MNEQLLKYTSNHVVQWSACLGYLGVHSITIIIMHISNEHPTYQ